MKKNHTNLVYNTMTKSFTNLYNECNNITSTDSINIKSLKSYNDTLLNIYEFIKVLLWSSKLAEMTKSLLSIMEFDDIVQDTFCFIEPKIKEIVSHELNECGPRIILYTKNHLIDLLKKKRLSTISYDSTPLYTDDQNDNIGLYELIPDTYTLESDINYLLITIESIKLLSPELALAWFGGSEYYGYTPSSLAAQIIEEGITTVYTKIMTSLYEENDIIEFKSMLDHPISKNAFNGESITEIAKKITNARYRAKKVLSLSPKIKTYM